MSRMGSILYWVSQDSFEFSHKMSHAVLSHSVVSDSLRPHESQHTRPPCPSPTPGVYSNSCPLRQWCHPTVSFSIIPFSSFLQSFPASGSFPISQFFASGGQSIGVSASASVFPEYSGLISFRVDWLDLLTVQETLKSLLQYCGSKISILSGSVDKVKEGKPRLSCNYWEKNNRQ